MLVEFENNGEVWIVMDAHVGWPHGVYVDEASAKEAVRQLQLASPDGFFRIVYSGLDEFVGNANEEEEDNWL